MEHSFWWNLPNKGILSALRCSCEHGITTARGMWIEIKMEGPFLGVGDTPQRCCHAGCHTRGNGWDLMLHLSESTWICLPGVQCPPNMSTDDTVQRSEYIFSTNYFLVFSFHQIYLCFIHITKCRGRHRICKRNPPNTHPTHTRHKYGAHTTRNLLL